MMNAGLGVCLAIMGLSRPRETWIWHDTDAWDSAFRPGRCPARHCMLPPAVSDRVAISGDVRSTWAVFLQVYGTSTSVEPSNANAGVSMFRTVPSAGAEAGFLSRPPPPHRRGMSARMGRSTAVSVYSLMEINMIAPAGPTDEQISEEFRQLLPELSSRLRARFFCHRPDLEDEHTAEAVALAWGMFQSARRRGKDVTAGNLAWYAIRSVLSGRRLAGSSSLDALSDRPLARERIGEHISLSDFEGDPEHAFYLTFGDRRWRWPVVDVVGTKMDWGSFITGCDHRDQRITEMKLAGYTQTEIAAELGVSVPAVCMRLRAMRRRWDDTQAVA